MSICFFGSYDPNYARNKILLDGLSKNGVKIFHCRSMSGNVLVRYPDLLKQFWQVKDQIDIIYVAFAGHLNVPLAYILGKIFRKKVVFDMFFSMYETYVEDRQSVKPFSVPGSIYFLLDLLGIWLSNLVITDTQVNTSYYSKRYLSNSQKFFHLYVGGDNTLFKPQNKYVNKIIIEFHGMFTRLQGAEYFIEAAQKLEKDSRLEFWLIGSSLGYNLPLKIYHKLKLKNLKYTPVMPVSKLAHKISQAHISVGHLGTTPKACRVVSNKIYQALFSRNAVIAPDNEATRLLLVEQKTTLFVQAGNSFDLTKKILILANNKRLRNQIALNGYRFARTHLTNRVLALKLIKKLKKI